MMIVIPDNILPEDRVKYLVDNYHISEHDAKVIVQVLDEVKGEDDDREEDN